MHERNIYKIPPDFAKLAEEYEAFGKHVAISLDGKGHLNFKDPEAVRELTYTLLKHDFGLHLDIPLDRLIPTVPLRLNYILWIEDLLKEGSLEQEPAKGIDIGCGASCIYPLLGTKLNNWNFIATEPDGLSNRFAQKNIEMNKLNSKIVLKDGNSDTLLKDVVEGNNQYDFCMCNPPFFSDREEALGFKSRTDKRTLPHSVCTATNNETITEGGEVAFVKKIITESTELKHSVRWYTSMLGKKSSLKTLNRYLTELKIPFVTHTVFQQGKTTRWGIAWSFFRRAKYQKKLSPVRKVNSLPFAFVVSNSEIQKYSKEKYKTLSENAKVKLIFGEIEKLLDDLEVSHFQFLLFIFRFSSLW